MDYILKVLNEESSEWEPIEAIKGADGEQGPAGPQGPQGEQGPQGPEGPAGTTEWSGIDSKPFESIGANLSVDSEGVLSADVIPPELNVIRVPELFGTLTQEEVDSVDIGTVVIFENVKGIFMCVDNQTNSALFNQLGTQLSGTAWRLISNYVVLNKSSRKFNGGYQTYTLNLYNNDTEVSNWLSNAQNGDSTTFVGFRDVRKDSAASTTQVGYWVEMPKIPVAPTSDGTYTLQCTVTNGVATYSWAVLANGNGVSY